MTDRQDLTLADFRQGYPTAKPDTGIAHVRVNFISSADGSVTLDGRSGGLGGENDRILMRVLRSESDVVLVGAGTVRAEGYGGLNMPPEHVAYRRGLGLFTGSTSDAPRVAIVSGSLDLTPDMSVFQKSEVRPLVFTHGKADTAKRAALSQVADVVTCGNAEVDLAEALHTLASLGYPRVLCEGGPTLFGSLLEQDLVDEVCLTVSPLFVAGQGSRIARSLVARPLQFEVSNLLQDNESFLFVRYSRAR